MTNAHTNTIMLMRAHGMGWNENNTHSDTHTASPCFFLFDSWKQNKSVCEVSRTNKREV